MRAFFSTRSLTQWVLLVLGLAAVCVQLEAVYGPPAETPVPHPELPWDKLAHALLFGVPVLLLRLGGIPARGLALAFLAHAVISEIVQGVFLPRRSGDPLDALADAAGIAVALLLTETASRRPGGPAAR